MANEAFGLWASIFKTKELSPLVLDRMLHHADTVVVIGIAWSQKMRHWKHHQQTNFKLALTTNRSGTTCCRLFYFAGYNSRSHFQIASSPALSSRRPQAIVIESKFLARLALSLILLPSRWRGSQVVRQGSAKALCVGSIPTLASSLELFKWRGLRKQRVSVATRVDTKSVARRN